MTRHISSISILVADYDEAIDFYVGKLGFKLLEDERLSDEKRWVRVVPEEVGSACTLLLAKASNEEQSRSIGSQSGGRVFLILKTDNFDEDYKRMRDKGVQFCEDPRLEDYGKVVVFEDLYGNKWDLIESGH